MYSTLGGISDQAMAGLYAYWSGKLQKLSHVLGVVVDLLEEEYGNSATGNLEQKQQNFRTPQDYNQRKGSRWQGYQTRTVSEGIIELFRPLPRLPQIEKDQSSELINSVRASNSVCSQSREGKRIRKKQRKKKRGLLADMPDWNLNKLFYEQEVCIGTAQEDTPIPEVLQRLLQNGLLLRKDAERLLGMQGQGDNAIQQENVSVEVQTGPLEEPVVLMPVIVADEQRFEILKQEFTNARYWFIGFIQHLQRLVNLQGNQLFLNCYHSMERLAYLHYNYFSSQRL
eukprot:TRINITY_DN729_c0_g1_i3.p2 TRINITY_DN729_c0_g1~~TRINITY_DN729_c0_g1_i3.p2  ORF type:complete len:284 (+),score=7.58 TRINITY_DN729_c0_g1_i3:262-1113(+)